jgi:hypothetical protein
MVGLLPSITEQRAGTDVLIVAGAILRLSFEPVPDAIGDAGAALRLVQYPSDRPEGDLSLVKGKK